jgi:uncharacterized protein (DUF697 family)
MDAAYPADGADWERTGYGPAAGHGSQGSVWQGVAGKSQELLEVTEEVAVEQQARLALLSRRPGLPCAFLAFLRQQTVELDGDGVAQEGVWLLATLPPPSAGAHTADGALPGNGAGFGGDVPGNRVQSENGTPSRDMPAAGTWDDLSVGMDGPSLAGAGAAWDANGNGVLAQLGDNGVDLLLYLFSGEAGWQDVDSQWCGRLRTLGRPLLPVMVLSSHDPAASEPGSDAQERATLQARLEHVHRKVGIRPVCLTLPDPPARAELALDLPPDDVLTLVDRMLALRPRISIPLAQDVPWCRQIIARRIIRTGALMTALVGVEPVPLLDLPIHVALQWKVALQLAAIHGRPGLDYRSREMVGAVSVNLMVRGVAQQLVKLIPVLGWLLSGALSGASTLLLGHALLRYYENDQIWDWPATMDAWGYHAAYVKRSTRLRLQALKRRTVGMVRRRPGSDAQELGAGAPTQEIPVSSGEEA